MWGKRGLSENVMVASHEQFPSIVSALFSHGEGIDLYCVRIIFIFSTFINLYKLSLTFIWLPWLL